MAEGGFRTSTRWISVEQSGVPLWSGGFRIRKVEIAAEGWISDLQRGKQLQAIKVDLIQRRVDLVCSRATPMYY